jgi:RNA polymerase sigma-70 factor
VSLKDNADMATQPEIEAEAVFEILVRENADMLMTYLRAVAKNSAVVDDIFQETMLTAWRKLDAYDRSLPFGPWLRGIAGRLVMAHYRKAKRNFMVCDDGVLEYLDEQVHHISQGRGDTWDEKVAALHECIEALPEIQKQAIGLRYMQNEAPNEIAERLELSPEAVKKRLQRARGQLSDCLRRKNVLPEMNP